MNKPYYVIEGAMVFWCGHSVHDFRSGWSQEVIRFERKEDAEVILGWILPEEYRRTCRVTEHLDMEP